MQIIFYVLLASLYFPIVGLCIQSAYAQSNSFLYQSSEYGISMPYPSEWEVEQMNEGHVVAFLSPLESNSDISPEILSITTEDLKPCSRISLEEYVEVSSGAILEELPNIQTIGEIEPMTIDGLPGYMRTYVFDYDPQIRNTQIITVTRDTAYVITYSRLAFDEEFQDSLTTALKMIGSLQIDGGQYSGSEFSPQEGAFISVHHDPYTKCGSGASTGSQINPY